MAETNYSAVDFSQLSATDDGKTVLYKDNQLCQSTSSLKEIIDDISKDKLDTSAFESVSGSWITTTVDNLENYYTTANTYTKTEVNEEIGKIGSFVTATLTTGEDPYPDISEPSTKIIYLTKDSTSLATDPYTEWIYTESNAWEIIGETTVDLSDYQTTAAMTAYYTKSETSGKQEIQDALDLKQNILTAGTDLVINNGVISVNTNGSAIGEFSFVEGNNTSAIDDYSHAEGEGTSAYGYASHTEGGYTSAVGSYSHAEGQITQTNGHNSHAEGIATNAGGHASHAEGNVTLATGLASHAEGTKTVAAGNYSHSEGNNTKAKGEDSHSEGFNTFAGDISDHVEGIGSYVEQGGCNHVEGFQYHSYNGTGPASNYYGTNKVKFYNPPSVTIIGNTINGSLYEMVKAFKDRFIVSCEYSSSTEYHYTNNSFFKPKLYKIIDVNLDVETNQFEITIDGTFDCQSGGSILLFGPTSITSINGSGGSLTPGQATSTFTTTGLGFTGNDLENVRPDNCFLSFSVSYTPAGASVSTSFYKIISPTNITYDSTTNVYTYECDESIEIPSDAQSGSYGFSVWVLNSDIYGCNHIEGKDNVIKSAECSHVEGSYNFVGGSNSHAEGSYTSAVGGFSHAEGSYTRANGSYSHTEGNNTYANSNYSHSEGSGTTAQGNASHSEGRLTLANAEASHAEGNITTAYGYASHAEGEHTSANGLYSHAEGFWTSAVNSKSHAEGEGTLASADRAHAEGHDTSASGGASHTEGSATKTLGDAAHAEGYGSYASGALSHAEGYCTTASGYASHAEGNTTIAYDAQSHAEGYGTSASGYCSHAEGYTTLAKETFSHAEGYSAAAVGYASHAEGGYTSAAGYESHAEGYGTSAANYYSHAEGQETQANSTATHAEGYGTVANGLYSHTEGHNSQTYGNAAHAEGYNTTAVGNQAHAEGQGTLASTTAAHAEGDSTTAQGYASHAEGVQTSALNYASHAGGIGTKANHDYTTVIGSYNNVNTAAFIVGNGSVDTHSDAFIVDWDGIVSATTLKNADGTIPSFIPTATQPANTTACTLYVDANGKFYIVTGTV